MVSRKYHGVGDLHAFHGRNYILVSMILVLFTGSMVSSSSEENSVETNVVEDGEFCGTFLII
jgi:hypothetical protein